MTRHELAWLTDEQLKSDIGITNGIHRKMILQAVEEDKHQEMAMFGRHTIDDNAQWAFLGEPFSKPLVASNLIFLAQFNPVSVLDALTSKNIQL